MNSGKDDLDIYKIEENQSNEQYFFDNNTIRQLADLAAGCTACLCTPSVGEALINSGRRDVFVFDTDGRLVNLYPEGQFWLYDLQRGLHSHASDANTKELIARFQHQFNTVIFDPPFSTDIAIVARNINAFLTWEYNEGNSVYVAYPRAGLDKLNELLMEYGIYGQEHPNIEINYVNPPEHYKPGAKKKISLLWFKRV